MNWSQNKKYELPTIKWKTIFSTSGIQEYTVQNSIEISAHPVKWHLSSIQIISSREDVGGKVNNILWE